MNRQEEILIGGGRGGEEGRAEGLAVKGDGEQAAISLTPDIAGYANTDTHLHL